MFLIKKRMSADAQYLFLTSRLEVKKQPYADVLLILTQCAIKNEEKIEKFQIFDLSYFLGK